MRRQTSYLKAVFETPAGLADEAAGILIAHGALGCAVQRGGRAGARSRRPVKLEAWFTELEPARLRAIRRTIRDAGMLSESDRDRRATRIIDPGWATAWQKRFAPLPIGERFLVVPPWQRASEPGRISIVVRPGRAFGTGHHPTTAGAMRAIGELCAERKFTRVLDVGTGSGILAIAAGLLGCKTVTAIEVDAMALENARENAHLNHVASRIHFSSPTPLARLKGNYDLVIANILSSVLVEIAPDLMRLTAKRGSLVLGGVLKREAATVASHYTPRAHLIEQRVDRGWVTMVLAMRRRGEI